MAIAMITEATYPHSQGGVSVWCDQTIRGLSEHRFHVVALCANEAAPFAWEPPGNVTQVTPIGLWDAVRAPKASPSEILRFRSAFAAFLAAVFENGDPAGFIAALRELFDLAQEGWLAAALHTATAVDDLLGHLSDAPKRDGETEAPRANVAEALEILSLLTHFLRPLSLPPVEAELCHSVSNGLGVLVALGAKWTYGTPFLLTEHGLYLRERFLEYTPGKTSLATHAFFPKFMSRLVRAGYEIADSIAPGSLYNRTWEMASGADVERIRPIYNGIDPEEFPAPPPEPESPTMVWLGRIDPLKDVHTLIRSFAAVVAALPGARLRLFGGVPAGNEEYAQLCHELVTELDLSSSVTFEGRVDSVARAYGTGHLVLNTSISEGFPYAVLEAMASGRCVVATDVGGVEEAIGNAGVLVPPRDPKAVADACLSLLADDERRRALGAAGRERVRGLFTVEQSNDAYRELYEQLCPPEASPRDAATPCSSAHTPIASRIGEYECAS